MRIKRAVLALIVSVYTLTLCSIMAASAAHYSVPAALKTFIGMDGTAWEQVSLPGFGNDKNIGVVAMAEYQGRLYAMTRNDTEGAQVWRTAGTAWEQVLFPDGATNGIDGNRTINNLFADMIVFKDKLYMGFSSGFQGGTLKSTGCEIWRYDGKNWEPVISDKKGSAETGTISAIAGCADKDGDTKGQITDRTKAWVNDQWAGGVLRITSGSGKYRRFDIVSNTADTLIIQQNEIAGATGTEYTICGQAHYKNPFPPYEYDVGAIQAGDGYAIGTGYHQNGFGDYWNRAVNCMVLYDNKLYVSTGLNYEYGAQVWFTEDGDSWSLTQPSRSFNLFHTDPTYPHGIKPVVVTVLSMCLSTVSGAPVLYGGGTGSSGNAGACARMAKLTDKGWVPIVDSSVGMKNGFGDGMGCNMFNGNFMPWSLADFHNRLYVGINSPAGARVLYTPNASSEAGSWFYSAGGDSGIPNGFDGKLNPGASAGAGKSFYKNIVANIFTSDGFLYAGLVSSFIPPFGGTEQYLTGAQMWKTADGRTWQQITGNGFGDSRLVSFEAFTSFNGKLYVSGSKAVNSAPGGIAGAKIFRQRPAQKQPEK